MIITKLQADKSKKVKVFIDGEYAFFISRKELDELLLEEGQEIDENQYDVILEEIIYPKAKEKALSILDISDKTENELRFKLLQAGYPDSIVTDVLDYLKSYGYINDERYARAYINSNRQTKSKLAIRTVLAQKGIDRDIVDRVMEEEYQPEDGSDYELEAIKRVIAKKTASLKELDENQRQKLIASLYRKGFTLDKIINALDCR